MTLLLIHTGGTIGMAPGPHGLRPEPGLVEAAIAARLPEGVALKAHVFAPLRDSADIGPADWNAILDALDAHPGLPALVTHGTDTMAFTGAALSQALAGAGRRVVMCGSMQPLGQGGDAERNLDLALAAAQAPGVGVDLAFDGRLLPAAGLVKHDSHAANAFRSQPQDPGTPPARKRFELDRKFAVLSLSPGLPASALGAMLDALDGAVLRVFGAGTVMNNPAILAVLRSAIAQGKRLRAVSQCEAGGLSPGAYAAGAALWEAGVENGGRETPEAALARLWLS
ncbi:L-asparaginase [Rhodobacter sp. JA431]|uniref:asparaginase domain-containing protein n=1 Tax=Rhodobacter sp. JA431 TaxID=570013 RepID=UPI000BD1FD03|nr:asparaginase domain-containing protein [Rhodobacter sp. JA431]SOC08835.1 L-asparaginase [Rhodobacter sp. JA431]